MKNSKGLFIGIAVIAVIIIAGIAAMAAGGNNKSSMGNSVSKAPSTASSSTSSKPTDSTAVAADAVSISNYMYNAPSITVKVGTKVTWTNMDSVHHNVVANTASADGPNGPLIGKGETYSFTFKKAGTYMYHCEPHPYMHGSVTVTE